MRRPQILSLLLALGLSASCGENGKPGARPRESGLKCRCVRVVDGDTIEVLLNGKLEKVRLVGVDTPETKHPRKPVQRYGLEASIFTTTHLTGKEVELFFKPDEKRDRYGRLLAYVHLDGQDFCARLIAEGYAHAYNRYPHSRMRQYQKLEAAAMAEGRGLWGDGR